MLTSGLRNARRHVDNNLNGGGSRVLLGAAAAAGKHVAGREEGAGGVDGAGDGPAGCRQHAHRRVGRQGPQRGPKAESQHLHRDPHAPQPALPRRAHERVGQRGLVLRHAGDRRIGQEGRRRRSRQDDCCFHSPAQLRSVSAL